MSTSWRFGSNDIGEMEGPNNPGISNFSGDRTGALVRESIQNSIDARECGDMPVEVSFQLRELSVASLDLSGLKRSFQASQKYPGLQPRFSNQFKRATTVIRKALKSKQIVSLRIVDSNTTGASDQGGSEDKWHSLTKTVGSSSKDSPDSAGSFGIGKHAPFAVTDLRTVLYSTTYREQGGESEIRRRFTGKSILVSHELDGLQYRASGWLENEDGPLADESVPAEFSLEAPGTGIDILGFNDRNWEATAKRAIVTSFFHALAHDNLKVVVGSTEVSNKTLDDVVADLEVDDNLLRQIEASRSPVLESVEIEGIGRVNLRIIVDHDGEHGQRTLALARDAGMMITDRLGSMKSTPSRSMVSFPRHWLGFTAVIECLSEGERSLLREAEGPKHNEISPDFADSSERDQVSKALRDLGDWIRTSIEKYAKPPDPTTKDNADEMADILPLEGSGNQLPLGNGQGEWDVSDPQQASRAPHGLRVQSNRYRRTKIDLPGGPEEGTPDDKKRKRRRGTGKRTETVQVPFNDLRRLPSNLAQWPNHTARFTFSRPQGNLKHIRLYTIGEDGRQTEIALERAYINGRHLPVRKGEIVEIPQDRINGDRVDLEIKAIRPISDRRVEIRLAGRRKAGKK